MKLNDIDFGRIPQERIVTIEEWHVEGEPVRILVRPPRLEDRIAIEQSGVKSLAEAGLILMSRTFLDPETREPMGSREDWGAVPLGDGLNRLVAEITKDVEQDVIESAKKNSKPARRSARRSSSPSGSSVPSMKSSSFRSGNSIST